MEQTTKNDKWFLAVDPLSIPRTSSKDGGASLVGSNLVVAVDAPNDMVRILSLSVSDVERIVNYAKELGITK